VNGRGTVFEIVKTAGGYASSPTLVSFNGTDGAGPAATLIFDANGNLFSTRQTEVGEMTSVQRLRSPRPRAAMPAPPPP
jgi:hypothetical protein